MNRAIEITREERAMVDATPKVLVHIYSHPAWDSSLILKAEGEAETPLDREIAEGHLGDDDDRSLLIVETGGMSKPDFDNLTEFDG